MEAVPLIRYIKKLISSQRGAFFVMTAMLLPLIVACGGVAIDIGNFYSHYARLQNTADASAMACAKVLAKDYDAEDKAIHTADDYKQRNEDSKNQVRMESEIKTVTEKGVELKAVKIELYEDVPYYFLKPLISLLNLDEKFITLYATAYCTVVPDDSGSKIWVPGTEGSRDDGSEIFDNLFVFEKHLTSVNNVQNPDNDRITQQKWNVSTYDGNVKATTQSGYQTTYDELRHNTMLKDAAFHGGNETTVAKAKEEGLVTDVECDESIDITKYYETNIVPQINEMFAKFQDPGYVPDEWQVPKKSVSQQDGENYYHSNQNVQNFDTSDINNWINSGVNTVYLNIPNVNFNFSGTIAGSKSDEPLFIILDGQPNINFSSDMTNSRPIIFVSTRGDSRYNKWSGEDDKMWLQSNGGYFRGALYAPYSSVGVNDNHHGFNGSIIGKNIYLGSQGYYTHDPLELPNNSHSTSTPGTEGHWEINPNNDKKKVILGGENYFN